MLERDHWRNWHVDYDEPTSSLSRRLAVVQRRLAEALDRAPSGPLRLISVCAGQGRDVIDVLARHPRGPDVTARLVEFDHDLVAHARTRAREAGLTGVEVVEGDASLTSSYQGFVPAEVLMVCGVFGNITIDDVRRTIAELPGLSAEGAVVIWTRHRRPPDLTPSIRAMFAEHGFDEVAFDTEQGTSFGVGTCRLAGPVQPYRPDRRMFTFVGDGSAPPTTAPPPEGSPRQPRDERRPDQ